MKFSSFLNSIAISLLLGLFNSAFALPSTPQKQTKQPIIGLPTLVEICRDYQPETDEFDRSEALAWLESQTSPVTLTIVSALWYGRPPNELEPTERPMSAIEACGSYPNRLDSEVNTHSEITLENRTQALEYWHSIIPQPIFSQFYQMWETSNLEEAVNL